MSENSYDLMVPPTRLDRAVDEAIAERNANFVYTDAARDADIENAARWASIDTARAAVGTHGVVLPIATAAALLAHLNGEDTGFLTGDLLGKMLADAIGKVGA